MMLADRLVMKHRIESHQFVNVDRLKSQFSRRPVHRLPRDVSKALLDSVQQHQRRASLLRIMCDHFVYLCFEGRGNREVRLAHQLVGDRLGGMTLVHRSHSPITKSNDPRIATTSLTMWPGRILGKMLRFTNDGARIFNRWGVPPPRL